MWASYDRALLLTNYRNNSWPTQIELNKLTIDNIKLSGISYKSLLRS